MIDRNTLLNRLKSETYDVLVIGGGATGAGVALDAASRGLRVGLVEASDFSSGTSSKSTKLIHGGVRYLEKAVAEMDFDQFRLVSEALHERFTLLHIAPHLTKIIPIVIPVYSWMQAGYYLAGMKIYELLSRKHTLGPTSFLSKNDVIHAFPEVRQDYLKGGIQLFDGQFNDARMNVSIILTAIKHGAAALNYVEVLAFEKQEGKICSIQVKDNLAGESFSIKAKIFVNATGPFSDHIRKLDDPDVKPIIAGSAGTHVLLSNKYAPTEKGMLIPHTSDGRLLFLLPWEGGTLVGTTDVPREATKSPQPTKNEVLYLLEHLKNQLGIDIAEDDIKATWAGIRPLVSDDGKKSSDISREFKILHAPSGLYSLVGGKWTSYRKMAETLVTELFHKKEFEGMPFCKTADLTIVGGEDYSPALAKTLVTDYGLEDDISIHLANSYGSKAVEVIKLSQQVKGDIRLLQGYPYLVGEVIYAIRYEMACTVSDILNRRMRLGMLDEKAALSVTSVVQHLLENESHSE